MAQDTNCTLWRTRKRAIKALSDFDLLVAPLVVHWTPEKRRAYEGIVRLLKDLALMD